MNIFVLGLDDPLFEEAKLALLDGEKFPVSFLQRKFRLGHTRALRLYEALRDARQGAQGDVKPGTAR